ncbi:MAG: TonB-dependent receptor plug domain-containing protein [Alistipes sp.]|nr:TonB-dependent receptor plug domain-containing protein [Alistipes sp.]
MRRGVIIAAMLLSATISVAEEPFNGLIVGLDGKGIKASIAVKGSDKRTRSDGKGRFGLTDIKADDTLYIIYKRDTTVIELQGRRSIHIVLAEQGDVVSFEESEELMNYGFGYVKRRESLDYSSGISGDRLRASGTNDLRKAIMMCYPGLKYINGELCLLTQNSINSSSAVLILCDGVECNLDYINIHDVKSVEIIKGSNMYGFRGVNGVILITTLKAEDVLK